MGILKTFSIGIQGHFVCPDESSYQLVTGKSPELLACPRPLFLDLLRGLTTANSNSPENPDFVYLEGSFQSSLVLWALGGMFLSVELWSCGPKLCGSGTSST